MPWYEPSSSAPRYSGGSRNSADGEEWSNGHQTNDTRNNNEQIISLQDYLDVNWHDDDDNNENTNNGYDNNYSSVPQQSRITFDSFQHRVEHQLGAAVFPSVASSSFAALNSSLFQTHFNHNHHHHHHDSSSHNNINGDDNRTATSFSKTAQFFHPRKVMALRQYEGFFSPLDSNFNNCSGAADNSQEANQQQSDECSNQHDDRLAVNAASDKQQHNIHIQPRNLFVSSQTNNSINNGHHDNYSAAAALPIGNGNYNSSSFHNSNNNYNKRKNKLPFVQATLRQDPTTGQLATSLQHDHHKERNTNEGRSTLSSSLLGGKATSWENYGGRPLMDGDNNLHEHGQSLLRESGKEQNDKKKNKKKAKKKRKDNSKGKDGGEKNEQCIDSIFQRQMGADENNADDGGKGGNSKKKKSKKTKQKRSFIAASSCELTIPTDQAGDNINIMANPTLSIKSAQPTLSEQDFEGMTNTMNAAQCMEGLQQFLSRVGQEPYVAWTMIFLDPLCHYRQYATDSSSSTGSNNNNSKRRKKSKKFSLNSDTAATMLLECTTPFLPSNKRYCTDKGPTCTAWNCTCDDQIRAIRGGAPLLGAMFVLNKSDEEGEGEDGGGATGAAAAEGGRRGKECYLLPLGPTEKCLDDLEAGYSRMKSWPIIPFDCEVSLSDRWSAFEAIISNNQRKMVTYNATTALMPFYHHQFHDECSMHAIDGDSQVSQIDDMLMSSQFTSCLTGTQDDNHNHFQRPANLRSIWDLRLVSWMLRPDVSDDQIEWSTFKAGFSHLGPDATTELYDGMPIVSRGLTEARTDLALLHSLYPLINEQLIRHDLLRSLENIEAPVQSILASMECRGVGFYPQRLKKVESKLSARIDELEARSRAVTQDSDFLLSSPQQVSQYLFDTLKLNVPEGLVSKTKSSHRSTSEETLKAIKADAIARRGSAPEILDIILEFRTLSKLLTTYIRPLPLLCVRGEGKSKKTPSRMHPQWMMTAVRTGRLSCRKPNLQQLPSDAVFGVKPRDAFVPSAREGMCVFACDYSQKEVRILAHMSNDEALISLFRGDANTDIYKQMASLIRNKPAESITPEERAQFKQVTLALLYGMSPNQVAKKLSISKSAAQQTMNDFFRRFRRVKSWMEETKQLARRNGYVLTIAGRRRYLNDIRSEDNGKRSQAERQAINTVIQGSAADLMKTAMIQLSENLQSWQEGTSTGELAMDARPQMVLQIHDEVLLELSFNERDIKKMQAIAVKSCCRDCEELFNLKVPLLLKCSCGLSFGSMKEI